MRRVNLYMDAETERRLDELAALHAPPGSVPNRSETMRMLVEQAWKAEAARLRPTSNFHGREHKKRDPLELADDVIAEAREDLVKARAAMDEIEREGAIPWEQVKEEIKARKKPKRKAD